MAPPAQAAVPTVPVCGRSEVLELVADEVAQLGTNAAILPDSVGQIPTALPDTVRCAVRLRTTSFDTNRFGATPQSRISIVNYTVRSGRNGLFVDVIGRAR